jgi:hypothetical protein
MDEVGLLVRSFFRASPYFAITSVLPGCGKGIALLASGFSVWFALGFTQEAP